MSSRVVIVVLVIFFFLPVLAVAQDLSPDPEVVHPNLQANVSNLANVQATDESKAAVAKAALSIVLSAGNRTCDPASHLNAVLEAYAKSSLRELSGKLAGASCLTKAGTVHLGAQFTPKTRFRRTGLFRQCCTTNRS